MLWPYADDPPADIVNNVTRRGLTLVRGSMPLLGAHIGMLGDRAKAYVRECATSHLPLLDAIAHPAMPALHADVYVAVVCNPDYAVHFTGATALDHAARVA